ncbi:alpha/beta hydrolase [Aquibaculum arenosum]|uniref:Alpha/beta hydrolase n=1 Tax=Aquibaculum arenosum TaxID=3032591 RepID=A0ABT5YME0_9PROT|nr:alpha/beta hydrolase [Fodinicurvata sp. CAU 1616]MDF2096012.1 alpha/beta hydrolase [Fodinicurvata sp. CAU 1616]
MTKTDLYRIRDFVPEFDEIAAEFSARSRALERHATMRSDIAYGSRPRETLDIIFPETSPSDAPLHVFVHGGYWRSGEKADYRFVAEPVLAAGGIAALVEYDLMPGQRLPTLVDQVRRALLWLQNHAAELGAAAERITVSGHSAGAHLASYLAATGVEEVTPALPHLKGLLLLSGIYDLSGIPDSFLKNEAEMSREEAAAWSPLDAKQHEGPHRIIAYGAEETPPFHEQAGALHDRLAAQGQPAELLALPGCNHMNILLELGDRNSALGARLLELMSAR